MEENKKVEEKVKDKRESVKETDKCETHEHETSKNEIEKHAIKQETEKYIREIASLKQELEMAKTIHEQQCLEMQKETKGVKAGLQARLNELESLLDDSNNRVKELETSAKSKCQSWSMKVNTYQSFMDSQFHALRVPMDFYHFGFVFCSSNIFHTNSYEYSGFKVYFQCH